MNTNSNPTPTLSRGLRKQLLSDVYEGFGSNLNEAQFNPPKRPESKTKAQAYRNAVALAHELLAGTILYETEIHGRRRKDTEYTALSLGTSGGGAELRILETRIPFRNTSAHVFETLPISFSKHALERVFQRLNTTDSMVAMQELYIPARFMLADKNWKSNEVWEIGTGRGMAIVDFKHTLLGQNAIVITWIDDSKLRRDQPSEAMVGRRIK